MVVTEYGLESEVEVTDFADRGEVVVAFQFLMREELPRNRDEGVELFGAGAKYFEKSSSV